VSLPMIQKCYYQLLIIGSLSLLFAIMQLCASVGKNNQKVVKENRNFYVIARQRLSQSTLSNLFWLKVSNENLKCMIFIKIKFCRLNHCKSLDNFVRTPLSFSQTIELLHLLFIWYFLNNIFLNSYRMVQKFCPKIDF